MARARPCFDQLALSCYFLLDDRTNLSNATRLGRPDRRKGDWVSCSLLKSPMLGSRTALLTRGPMLSVRILAFQERFPTATLYGTAAFHLRHIS